MPNVVLAFDGSVEAGRAVESVRWLDSATMKLSVVTAVDGPAIDDRGDAVDADTEQLAAAERSLAACKKRLGALGIDAETRVVIGDPASAVVEFATACDADLIITGSRGLGFAKRMVLGSTSAAIASRAPCSVLIVR